MQAQIEHLQKLAIIANQDLTAFKNLPVHIILQQRKVVAKRILKGGEENREIYGEMMDYCNEQIKLYFGIW